MLRFLLTNRYVLLFVKRYILSNISSPHVLICAVFLLQQAEVPEDSDDEDPDEVFGFITMLNLTERKVTAVLFLTLLSSCTYSFIC